MSFLSWNQKDMTQKIYDNHIFNEYSKKYKGLTFSIISIFDNRDYYQLPDFDRYEFGYCKIKDFIFIITGKEAHLYAKKAKRTFIGI